MPTCLNQTIIASVYTAISVTLALFNVEVSVAKRKACLQPEKTHSYQYLFAVQYFNSYVYRGRINKGYLGGLDKVFKIRDRHHRGIGFAVKFYVKMKV